MDSTVRYSGRQGHVPSQPGEQPLAEQSGVYLKFRRGLLFMLRRLVGDAATADDLCQEACRIVTERLQSATLEDPSRLAAFIHQTARNLAIAELRKRARRQTDTNSSALEEIPDKRFDPYDAAEREQHAMAVRRLLKELRQPRDQLLLRRLFLDEADKAEICMELGLSDEHFNRVLFRAKERFREILQRAGITALLALLFAAAAVCTAHAPPWTEIFP